MGTTLWLLSSSVTLPILDLTRQLLGLLLLILAALLFVSLLVELLEGVIFFCEELGEKL